MKRIGDDVGHAYDKYEVPQIEHRYGSNVKIVSDPCIRAMLSRFCDEANTLPLIGQLLKEMYRGLSAIAIGAEFPKRVVQRTTRMKSVLRSAEVVSAGSRAITVAIARAGMLSSQVCFEQLLHFFDPRDVRQDYLHMARTVGADEKVTGAEINAAKVGGDIQDAFVIIPDPMGATGSSMDVAVTHYKNVVEGTPAKMIAVHLIITPEYLRLMRSKHPEMIIYAARVDRAHSIDMVLDSIPGEHWDMECGLTEQGYIDPGAGGIGEILNQSFV